MKWKDADVRQWLYKTGMEHIEADLYAEGGELLFYAKFYQKQITQETFAKILKRVCAWENEEINIAVLSIKKLTAFT